jgi:hypothetical protein
MFTVIDHALDGGDVWFRSWRFQRAGAEVEMEGEESVNTGYFVVLPPDGESSESRAWRVETHMEIRGHARDHAALSTFVRRLYEQPSIEDVKVLKTNAREYDHGSLVDFDLAVVVAGRGRGR